MYKIKRRLVLFALALSLLTGCGKEAAKETKQEKPEKLAGSAYLDTSVLEDAKEEVYEVYTVSYGTYEEKSVSEKGYIGDYVRYPLIAEVEVGTQKVLNIDNFQGYHSDGDPLLLVEAQVDEADVRQAQLALQRLTERYARDTQEFLEQREKDIAENDKIGDKYEFEAGRVLLERDVLVWQNTARLYERQIQRAKEEADRLQKAADVTAIYASGKIWCTMGNTYAGYAEQIYNGSEITNGTLLGYYQSYEQNPNYVYFENHGSYRYGMELTWDFKVKRGANADWEEGAAGHVINAMPDDLYGNLDDKSFPYSSRARDGVFLQLDVLKEAKENPEIIWEQGRDMATGNMGEIENVLLVPKKAVTEKEGVCYVTVVKPDGSFVKTGFIAGGSNTEYYWVLEGLREGTQILAAKN